MKSWNRFMIIALVFMAVLFAGINGYMAWSIRAPEGKPYRVEIGRIEQQIASEGAEAVDCSQYQYVTKVEKLADNREEAEFFFSEEHYEIRLINGNLYRFEYRTGLREDCQNIRVAVNLLLLGIAAFVVILMLYIRQKILKPFLILREVPYELSRGNLSVPIQENKSRFFGRFTWGLDLLRQNIEEQKERELRLLRDKKRLLLTISHDIKTPISAIKLYARALSKGLYARENRQNEIADKIDAKADEIEAFVGQMVRASNEEFLELEVPDGEFYLRELVDAVVHYYREKLGLIQTEFSAGTYANCLLKGDLDRAVEVIQNIMENAVKYGDGKWVRITFSEEEECQLVTIENSGCTLPGTELPHIFDSFWRGSNAGRNHGSGLGLYIARQLMGKMGGEIFADAAQGCMHVTVVFRKAV